MSNSTVFNRMSDVLFALEQAGKARVRPTKIQLQKFIYLSDALGQLVGVLRPKAGHKTYRNGPYDAAIQNAVDALAFRGFVRIAGIWRTPNGTLGTSYVLSAAGNVLLQKFHQSETFVQATYIAGLVGTELLQRGWDQVVNFVYAEPTFVSTRPSGWGAELRSEDGLRVSAAFLIAVIRRASAELNLRKQPDTNWVTDRFFAFLRDYHENYSAQPGSS
jgi:hypothetical protein